MTTTDGVAANEARVLKAHLDDAVAALGLAMHERFAPGLSAELGRTWFKRVRPSQGAFAEFDFSSYADCLLGDNERTREHRDLFRRVAGKPWSEYGTTLESAKRARNAISHPNRRFTRGWAAQLLDDLAAFAHALDLGPAPDLVQRAQAARTGDLVDRGIPHLEGRRAAVVDLATEIERFEEQKAALAEELRAAEARESETVKALAAEREEREREQELRRRAEERLALSRGDQSERERLERETARHQRTAEEARSRAAVAKRDAASAQAARDELERRFQASQAQLSELQEQSRQLTAEVAPAEEPTTVDLEELRRLIESRLGRPEGAQAQPEAVGYSEVTRVDGASSRRAPARRELDPDALAYHSVLPGEKWPYGAGEHSYSLRPSTQDIYHYDTDTWLSDVIGKKKTKKVFARLAEHRPEGGTIRVDSDGDVSTQRKAGGGRFYLGRVTTDEWFPDVIEDESVDPSSRRAGVPGAPALRTDVGPAVHSVLPGEKWPYGAGEHSYSLRPSTQDIYHYDTDTWLSDVIGKKKTKKVFARLAEHRPEGGTIRVDSDGDVSTQRKAGGGRFYLGRVTTDEWFPDVIEK